MLFVCNQGSSPFDNPERECSRQEKPLLFVLCSSLFDLLRGVAHHIRSQ